MLEGDIDFLLVFGTRLAPVGVEDLVRKAAVHLPTTTMMAASQSEYELLETSLGYEFKNLGVSVNQAELPPHDPVVLQPRDALEILIFSIQFCLWNSLTQRWFDGDRSHDFRYQMSRACIKLLRTVGLLNGAQMHSDLTAMPEQFRGAMGSELRWRTTQEPDVDAGRFWSYLAMTLDHFDCALAHRNWMLSPAPSTTTARERAWSRGINVWRCCWRGVWWLGSGRIRRRSRRLRAARDAVWDELVAGSLGRPTATPEEFFAGRREVTRDHLYWMKVDDRQAPY